VNHVQATLSQQIHQMEERALEKTKLMKGGIQHLRIRPSCLPSYKVFSQKLRAFAAAIDVSVHIAIIGST
jgi:hypothetical protein